MNKVSFKRLFFINYLKTYLGKSSDAITRITLIIFRSSHPEMFLEKGVLKICSKFTGEHSCRSVILIKLVWNFIEITLRHGCSPVNLLHIFRTLFTKNNSGWLLLHLAEMISKTNNQKQQSLASGLGRYSISKLFLILESLF